MVNEERLKKIKTEADDVRFLLEREKKKFLRLMSKSWVDYYEVFEHNLGAANSELIEFSIPRMCYALEKVANIIKSTNLNESLRSATIELGNNYKGKKLRRKDESLVMDVKWQMLVALWNVYLQGILIATKKRWYCKVQIES